MRESEAEQLRALPMAHGQWRLAVASTEPPKKLEPKVLAKVLRATHTDLGVHVCYSGFSVPGRATSPAGETPQVLCRMIPDCFQGRPRIEVCSAAK